MVRQSGQRILRQNRAGWKGPYLIGYVEPKRGLSVIDPEEIERLLADLESDRVERTESVNNSAKFCKAICAFANDLPGHRAPGYLCIGVDARGTPSSTPIDERLLETLAGHRSNGQIIPIPTMEVAKVQYRGVPIAVVKVEPSDLPPVRYQMQTWIRVGPSARLATQEEEPRLTERVSIALRRGTFRHASAHRWTIWRLTCFDSTICRRPSPAK
jgi:hypothetical protein